MKLSAADRHLRTSKVCVSNSSRGRIIRADYGMLDYAALFCQKCANAKKDICALLLSHSTRDGWIEIPDLDVEGYNNGAVPFHTGWVD